MKYYGSVGYAETVETNPGVWEEEIVERNYAGDILRNTKKFENGEHLNDNLNIANRISILSDPYAMKHFSQIRYVTWYNSKWKVSEVEVQFPRLILTIGGVYNGETED